VRQFRRHRVHIPARSAAKKGLVAEQRSQRNAAESQRTPAEEVAAGDVLFEFVEGHENAR
jgi:hypothetical protein